VIDAGKHISELGLRIDAVQARGLDQRVHDCGALAPAVRTSKQPRLAAKGNLPFILPMSGKKSRFITVVRQEYSEQRTGGRVVHVEAAPGVIIVLAAWMLDPAAYAGMELGAPHADIATLSDLHRPHIAQGD
jgi:hypothetical protein